MAIDEDSDGVVMVTAAPVWTVVEAAIGVVAVDVCGDADDAAGVDCSTNAVRFVVVAVEIDYDDFDYD